MGLEDMAPECIMIRPKALKAVIVCTKSPRDNIKSDVDQTPRGRRRKKNKQIHIRKV